VQLWQLWWPPIYSCKTRENCCHGSSRNRGAFTATTERRLAKHACGSDLGSKSRRVVVYFPATPRRVFAIDARPPVRLVHYPSSGAPGTEVRMTSTRIAPGAGSHYIESIRRDAAVRQAARSLEALNAAFDPRSALKQRITVWYAALPAQLQQADHLMEWLSQQLQARPQQLGLALRELSWSCRRRWRHGQAYRNWWRGPSASTATPPDTQQGTQAATPPHRPDCETPSPCDDTPPHTPESAASSQGNHAARPTAGESV
jgi:hypothetical protein